MIEDLQQSFGEEIEHHKASIDSIQEILPASKTRVLLVRFIIGIVGALIAFGFFQGGVAWRDHRDHHANHHGERSSFVRVV